MSVFINNGLSGLLAAQTALQTTANNVANAATDGYVRQRVELSERPSTVAAGASIGNGVSVNGVRRVYDQFVADEVKTAAMSQQRARQINDLSSRLDKLLGNPEQGISQSVQAFFAQADALSRDPTSTVNREQLLSEARVLSDRFAQTEQQILRLGNEVDGRLQQDVSQINDLARSLSQINDRIAASANAVPNDLLDERERLLTSLSELIDFTTIRQQDGSVNVLVGNGQPLVLGVKAYELGLVPNEFDGSRLELAANGQPISGLIAGGEVAGLLAFRNENLDAATRQLGQLALGLTEVFNEQHRQGMDLNGDLGSDFFAGIQTTVISSSNNSGSATVTLNVADPAAIEARDYILRYTGSAWELMDAASGAPVSMTGSGTAVDPFLAEGLSITASAGAAAGDRFLVSAVRNAMSGVKLAISDTAEIAAASPVSTAASLSNLSDATISSAS
ncbi:MAG TPA: flagellar hook-associated protein FlgK, partial [Chromatiales bacterium]|nr:flagellar hook-associated protein FlgK [Chromatiales bacterium]